MLGFRRRMPRPKGPLEAFGLASYPLAARLDRKGERAAGPSASPASVFKNSVCTLERFMTQMLQMNDFLFFLRAFCIFVALTRNDVDMCNMSIIKKRVDEDLLLC